jgi:hypothetical protein
MLFTCKFHVTHGLKKMDVPHVKRIHHRIGDSCYFCKRESDFKLFYSLPFYRLIHMKPESLPTGIEQPIVI